MRLCDESKIRAARGGAALLSAVLVACSAALDWRTAPLSAPVQALLPCKPEQGERTAPLLGPDQPAVPLRVLSCTADGRTWVLAEARLPHEAAAPQAMTHWLRASWATLGVAPEGDALPPGWLEQPCQARGAAQQRCVRGHGQAPDGRAVLAQLHYSARGGWLLQAAVYGGAQPLPQAQAEAFWGAVAWRAAGP